MDLDSLSSDAASVRKDDSGKQVQQGGLTAATGSDQGRLRPLLQQQIRDSKLKIALTVTELELFNLDHDHLLRANIYRRVS